MQSLLARRLGVLAELGIAGIVEKVMADVEIQVAVAVQVGEGRRGRPVAIAAQSGLARHVLEPPVPFVAIECVRMPARDKQVRPAIVVVVTDRDSVTVARRERGDARAVRSHLRMCRRRGCGTIGRRHRGLNQSVETALPERRKRRANRLHRSRANRPRRTSSPGAE